MLNNKISNYTKREIFDIGTAFFAMFSMLISMFFYLYDLRFLGVSELKYRANGFTVIWNSAVEVDGFSGWLAFWSIAQIVLIAVFAILLIGFFWVNKTYARRMAVASFITMLVLSLIYMVNGFACVSAIKKSYRYADIVNVMTGAFWPVIIIVLIGLANFFIKFYMQKEESGEIST